MTSLPTLIGDARIKSRLKNRNLRSRVLQPTDENRAMLAEYKALEQAINDTPARIRGLSINYRKRDIPAEIARLMAERQANMEKLIALEAKLFPDEA